MKVYGRYLEFSPQILRMVTNLVLGILLIGTILMVLKIERSIRFEVLTRWVPAVLLAYLLPALFNSLFLNIGNDHIIHNFSKQLLLPLTVLAAMASMHLNELRIVGARPLLFFVISSAIIALCPVVLGVLLSHFNTDFHHFFIEEKGYTASQPVVGSWIGGSSSMLVLKELANTPESLFVSVLILDNIIVNIWTIGMFQWIKKTTYFNQRFKRNEVKYAPEDEIKLSPKNRILTLSMLGLGFLALYPIPLSFLQRIVIYSILGLLLGNFFKFWDHRYLQHLSKIFIIAVMSILGLKLEFSQLSFNTPLLLFLVLWILVQFIISFWVALKMKISLVWVPLASMANVGGVSTAPAVASAYDKRLMPHAVVLAIISMVTGTFWGLITLTLFDYVIPLM